MLNRALWGIVLALALSQKASASELMALIDCDDDVSTTTVKTWCLRHQLEPNRQFSILGTRNCSGTTGQPFNIENSIESFVGTKLSIKCARPLEDNPVALFDASARQFRKATVKTIERSPHATQLRKRVEATPEFKKRRAIIDAEKGFAAEPVWSGVEIRFSSRTLSAISSELIRYPTFLVGDKFMRLWGEGGYEYGVVQAFELNGTEVIHLQYCVAGTDGCDDEFKLGPDF